MFPMTVTSGKSGKRSGVIAVCGNPNCGKTTIFNAITGLNQQVGNYAGVTVEKVSGRFDSPLSPSERFTLIDIPGSYSLSAYTPDEYIAASALFGELQGESRPDAIICVMDATQLERGLYLLLQILQIGKPVVVALNMMDLARQAGLRISSTKLSRLLGGVPVVGVVGNRRKGIERLKQETARVVDQPAIEQAKIFDKITEDFLSQLAEKFGNSHRSRAQYLRIIFDEHGQAERKFIADEGKEVIPWIEQGRRRIREAYGSLVIAETKALTRRAEAIYRKTVRDTRVQPLTRSEKIDRFLLHPILGPVVLVTIMVLVFQSIFTWAAPFMHVTDGAFSSLADLVRGNVADGPLRSLVADGIIGGVGSVLIFVPQIAILFIFIALLEDSGYMPRAAFLVDRMFRWCGLSGKSFIPMLSSFACAVPGILATRTIEDRKLRLITIMVAPLMTCSARLPVYAIMIAAFIPYRSYFGILNLQGLVLTMLYLLGIAAAVLVSFVMNKTVLKTERGTFMMEMPSYKWPTLRSISIRVLNRVKSFLGRAGTIVLAITVVIWALSYYPRSAEVVERYNQDRAELTESYQRSSTIIESEIGALLVGQSTEDAARSRRIGAEFEKAASQTDLRQIFTSLSARYAAEAPLLDAQYRLAELNLAHRTQLNTLANRRAGDQIRSSFLAMAGRWLEPLFRPLGWDWKITVSVLAAFPAREVIIATLGTIYNLGSHVDEHSTSLVEKMRNARHGEGPREGQLVFSPAVALSIMVFFALCLQCGATLVTIRQEAARWTYSAVTFGYMTTMAYLSAMAVYQLVSGLGL